MSRCIRCQMSFRTLPDEHGDYPCPRCGVAGAIGFEDIGRREDALDRLHETIDVLCEMPEVLESLDDRSRDGEAIAGLCASLERALKRLAKRHAEDGVSGVRS